MASGLTSSSEPIEPTRVWTAEEWREQAPWGAMPKSDLRNFFKSEAFLHIYGAGPNAFRRKYDSATGRFPYKPPPWQTAAYRFYWDEEGNVFKT